MSRKKGTKNKVKMPDVKDMSAEEFAAVEEGEKQVKELEKAEKGKTFKLLAKFRAKDKEGNKVLFKYTGEGKTLLEALDSLAFDGELEDVGLRTGKYPKGLNASVALKFTYGSYNNEIVLAPHVARQILDDRREDIFYFKFSRDML